MNIDDVPESAIGALVLDLHRTTTWSATYWDHQVRLLIRSDRFATLRDVDRLCRDCAQAGVAPAAILRLAESFEPKPLQHFGIARRPWWRRVLDSVVGRCS